jgi:hypothetical protein
MRYSGETAPNGANKPLWLGENHGIRLTISRANSARGPEMKLKK